MSDPQEQLNQHIQERIADQVTQYDAGQDELLTAFQAGGVQSSAVAQLMTSTYISARRFEHKTRPLIGHWLLEEIMGHPRDLDNVPALAPIVNRIVLPLIEKQSQRPAYPAHSTNAMAEAGACSDAEYFFAAAAAQVLGAPEGVEIRSCYGHAALSVYHNAAGTPLLLQKQFDEPTALTLEPLHAHGVLLPPGMIVGVGQDIEAYRHTGSADDEERALQLDTYDLGEVASLDAVLRCSPWVHANKLDRAMFSVSYFAAGEAQFKPDRYKLVTTHTIDTFRAAAQRIMQLCGTSVTTTI